MRRIERAPLPAGASWREPGYGLGNDFGVNPYTIDGHPICAGERADEDLIVEAARDGWVNWTFIPLALGSRTLRQRWGTKDRSLRIDHRRDPRAVAPCRLYGPCAVGTAHDHIYQLGRKP